MKALILLQNRTSVSHSNVVATYIQDDVYHLVVKGSAGDQIYKYPLANIFKIQEDVGDTTTKEKVTLDFEKPRLPKTLTSPPRSDRYLSDEEIKRMKDKADAEPALEKPRLPRTLTSPPRSDRYLSDEEIKRMKDKADAEYKFRPRLSEEAIKESFPEEDIETTYTKIDIPPELQKGIIIADLGYEEPGGYTADFIRPRSAGWLISSESLHPELNKLAKANNYDRVGIALDYEFMRSVATFYTKSDDGTGFKKTARIEVPLEDDLTLHRLQELFIEKFSRGEFSPIKKAGKKKE